MRFVHLVLVVFLGLAVPAWGSDGERVPITAPSPETYPVLISIETVTSVMKKGKPVPSITVEVGVGQHVDHVRCLEDPVLAGFETDEEGLGTTEVRVPVRFRDDPSAQLWIRVETPGYRRTTKLVPLAELGEGPRKLVVRRGGTVFGSYCTASGEPIPNARIWLLREGGKHYQWGRTSAEGTFAIDFSKGGFYRVHARSSQPGAHCGTAHLGPLELDIRRPMPPIDLVQRPISSMAGRVVDPAGDPVVGARVLVLPKGILKFPDAHACAEAEREVGFASACGRADKSGRFEIGRLLPGEYDFYCELDRGGWSKDSPRGMAWAGDGFGEDSRPGFDLVGGKTRVATLRVDSRTDDLRLVYALHRVEVTVEESSGHPVDLFTLDEDGDVESVHLQVLGLGYGGWRHDTSGPRCVDGVLVFPLRPATDYTALWNDRVHALIDHPFSTNAGGPWLSTLGLKLEPARGAARVFARVVDPAGSPLPPKVDVRSAVSQREILCAWGREDGGRWSTDLPAGRFHLTATAEPSIGCVITSPMPRAEFTPSAKDIELIAGEVHTLDFRLGVAGYLDLNSMAPPSGISSNEDSICIDERGYHDCSREEVRQALGGGFARLTSESGHRIENLEFEVDLRLLGLPWIVPGWNARCMAPIPPGTWVFEVLGDSGVMFRRDVVIEAGKATILHW